MLDTLASPPADLGGFAPTVAPAPAAPTMDAFLGDFARKNPDLAWLTQMLAAQRQLAAPAPVGSEIDDGRQAEIDALTEQLALADAHAAKLQRVARRLQAELEIAQERLTDLASAFGACGICWGQDPGCRGCRGHGKLGMFAPDPEQRLRFVAEAVPQPAAFAQPIHRTETSDRR